MTRKLLPIFFLCLAATSASAQPAVVSAGKWSVAYDPGSGAARILRNGTMVLDSLYASTKVDGKTYPANGRNRITTSQTADSTVLEIDIYFYKYIFSRVFTIYPGIDRVSTYATIESADGRIAVENIIPISGYMGSGVIIMAGYYPPWDYEVRTNRKQNMHVSYKLSSGGNACVEAPSVRSGSVFIIPKEELQ